MKRWSWIAWITLAGAAACSDANVAGTYNAQLTNRSDGCSMGLTKNEVIMATFTVTQSDSEVTLSVEGIPGVFVAGQLGTNAFTGEVDGDEISLGVTGTAPHATTGTCRFTFNAAVRATLEGDAMSGRVEYRAATNSAPDCGTREGCVTIQDFNATRPPAAEE